MTGPLEANAFYDARESTRPRAISGRPPQAGLTGKKDRGDEPPKSTWGLAVRSKKPWGPDCPVKTMKPDNSGGRSEGVPTDYQLARVALFLSTLERRGAAGRMVTGP